MAVKSKITGIELPEKGAALVESYVKCAGRGMPPVDGTDADGIKGTCPECRTPIELRESAEGPVMVAHLAGGKTQPPPAGIKGVRTSVPTRTPVVPDRFGHAMTVTYRGNVPGDVAEVGPMVRGRDMDGRIPSAPRLRPDGTERKTNGTWKGGIGRPHIVMNPATDLVGKSIPGMHGANDPRITRAEYEKLNKRGRQRYNKKIGTMRDAALAQYAKRREFVKSQEERGVTPVCGDGPTAARPYGSVPAGTRTAQMWDGSKGGRMVDVIERRKGERSIADGYDRKPSGIKYKSEPIFGRTVRKSA